MSVMTSRASGSQHPSLGEQAVATRRAAEALDNEVMRNQALAGAETIAALDRAQKRRIQPAEPVLVLPANASAAELKEGRVRRAVRRGNVVYLPSWRESATGLPSVFLRSALFGAANVLRESVMAESVSSLGDTSLTLTGYRLCDYDRRVFAACLDCYCADRPLSNGTEETWVKMTYWQFAKGMNVAYGANVHSAIRASLIRLNAAQLRVRVKGEDVPISGLIDVALDDFQAGGTVSTSRASDLVVFRIREDMANLFGPADWSAVSKSALHQYAGLTGWLTGFYATHAKSYDMPMVGLHGLSGSRCDLREFKRRLRDALAKLSGDDVPDSVRIDNFTVTKTHANVKLLRWCGK